MNLSQLNENEYNPHYKHYILELGNVELFEILKASSEELLKTIDAIAFTNMDERLEFYLKKQVDKLGNNLKMTHQDIASDLNSSREVVSRLLKKMEAKGWLIIDRNSIEWLKG